MFTNTFICIICIRGSIAPNGSTRMDKLAKGNIINAIFNIDLLSFIHKILTCYWLTCTNCLVTQFFMEPWLCQFWNGWLWDGLVVSVSCNVPDVCMSVVCIWHCMSLVATFESDLISSLCNFTFIIQSVIESNAYGNNHWSIATSLEEFWQRSKVIQNYEERFENIVQQVANVKFTDKIVG